MLDEEKIQPLLLVQNVKITSRTGGSRPNMNPREERSYSFRRLPPVLREVDELVFTYAALFQFHDNHPICHPQ